MNLIYGVGLALNVGAFLTIIIGSIKNRRKKFIAPYLAVWLALFIVAVFVFGGGFADRGAGPVDMRYLVKFSLLFIDALLFVWLPLRPPKPAPAPKKPQTPVKAFDERTRV